MAHICNPSTQESEEVWEYPEITYGVLGPLGLKQQRQQQQQKTTATINIHSRSKGSRWKSVIPCDPCTPQAFCFFDIYRYPPRHLVVGVVFYTPHPYSGIPAVFSPGNATLSLGTWHHSCQSDPFILSGTWFSIIWPQLYLCKVLATSPPVPRHPCSQLLIHWLWNALRYHARLFKACPSSRSVSCFAFRNIQVSVLSRPQVSAASLCLPLPYPLTLVVTVSGLLHSVLAVCFPGHHLSQSPCSYVQKSIYNWEKSTSAKHLRNFQHVCIIMNFLFSCALLFL